VIGEPTLDPALGEKRRKALQAALARAGGFGGPAQQSAPRYGGVGRGSVSGFGFKPISRGGRPSSILDFLGIQTPGGYVNGKSSFFGAGGGLGKLIADVQMPQPLPAPAAPAQGGTSGLAPDGSTYGVPTYGGDGSSTGTTQLPVVQPGTPMNDTGQVTPNGVDNMTYGISPQPGSGMIPLGGGVFLDPDTGMIHGAGGMTLG
jgi:hypothetical protein